MKEQGSNRRLQDPENLGAPMKPYWGPGVRRYLNRQLRFAFGFESARFVLLSLVAGALVIVALFVLGNLVNSL